MRKGVLAISALFLLAPPILNAQDKSLVFFSNVPQSSYINPAFIPKYTRYIGIPLLSATRFSINSSTYSFDDITYKKTVKNGESFNFDLNKILQNLRVNNNVRTEVSNDIFSFGFKRKKIYWSMSMQIKSFSTVYAPKSLEQLRYGNIDYTTMGAKDISLNNISVNSYLYYETGFAGTYMLNDNLRIGGRIKVLNGIAGVSTQYFYANLLTASDFSKTTLQADVRLNTSVKGLSFGTNTTGGVNDVALQGNIMRAPFTSNYGLGIDLGVDGNPMRNLRVFASLTDLGFIAWNKDMQQLSTNETYTFNGADLTPDENGNINSQKVFKAIADTLKNKFQLKQGGSSFRTSLFTKVYAGAEYQAKEWLSLGILFKGAYSDMVIDPGITISAKATPYENLSGLISLSYYNKTLNNVGFGIVAGSRPIQLYLVADNIPVRFIKGSSSGSSASIPIPNKSRSVNIQLGVSYIFGEKCYKLPWRWKSFEKKRDPR